jgi:hypothetical protein
MALDELAVDGGAADRARRELGAAFVQIEGDGSRVQNGRGATFGRSPAERGWAVIPESERQADG